MEREELLKIILGERYEEGREIAGMVLDYVKRNPDWQIGGRARKVYKTSILEALDKAVYECYGHDLAYYSVRCRKREFVDARQMAMHLYHEKSGCTIREIGEIFGKHHSTVIFAFRDVENNLKFDKAYAQDYKALKESFKKYLDENH